MQNRTTSVAEQDVRRITKERKLSKLPYCWNYRHGRDNTFFKVEPMPEHAERAAVFIVDQVLLDGDKCAILLDKLKQSTIVEVTAKGRADLVKVTPPLVGEAEIYLAGGRWSYSKSGLPEGIQIFEGHAPRL